MTTDPIDSLSSHLSPRASPLSPSLSAAAHMRHTPASQSLALACSPPSPPSTPPPHRPHTSSTAILATSPSLPTPRVPPTGPAAGRHGRAMRAAPLRDIFVGDVFNLPERRLLAFDSSASTSSSLSSASRSAQRPASTSHAEASLSDSGHRRNEGLLCGGGRRSAAISRRPRTHPYLPVPSPR